MKSNTQLKKSFIRLITCCFAVTLLSGQTFAETGHGEEEEHGEEHEDHEGEEHEEEEEHEEHANLGPIPTTKNKSMGLFTYQYKKIDGRASM